MRAVGQKLGAGEDLAVHLRVGNVIVKVEAVVIVETELGAQLGSIRLKQRKLSV